MFAIVLPTSSKER